MPQLKNNTAFIVVDVQNDFCSAGALAVPNAEQIIPVLNQLMSKFHHIVLTQDWHPANHVSFASQHPGQQPFELTQLSYGPQVLWPEHCVQGSFGAQFHPQLNTHPARLVVRKGQQREVDSYSAFLEADRKSRTGLAGFLKDLEITQLYVCGLATDYCVAWTALDAVQAGFQVHLVEDASRAIDLNGSLDKAWVDLQQAGVQRVFSENISLR